jgi:SecD/SecF fusion protein
MRRFVLGLATAALLLGLASCGGGGGGDESNTSSSNILEQLFGVNEQEARAQLEVVDWEPNLIREVSKDTKAPQGTKVVQAKAQSAPGVCTAGTCYFLIGEDQPALTGDDITSAKASTDPATGQPTVELELSDEAAGKFQDLTRAVAQRGAQGLKPGAPPGASAGHFAFILGDRVLSLPIIDPTQNPNGIDPSNGIVIEGGLTATEAHALANALNP